MQRMLPCPAPWDRWMTSHTAERARGKPSKVKPVDEQTPVRQTPCACVCVRGAMVENLIKIGNGSSCITNM